MNRFVILRLSWNLMTDSVLFSLLPSQLWRQMCSTVLAKTKVHECFLIKLSWDHLGQGPSLWQTRTLQEGQFRISGQRIQLVPLLFKSSPLTPTWRLSCKHPSLSSFTNWRGGLRRNRAAGEHLAGLSPGFLPPTPQAAHTQIYPGSKGSNIYLWNRKNEVLICILHWRRLDSPIGCPLVPTVVRKVCSHYFKKKKKLAQMLEGMNPDN